MIKKYDEFLNENKFFSGYVLKEFTKNMSAEAIPVFSVVKFSDSDLEDNVTVIYDAIEGTFIVTEKLDTFTPKSFDIDKLKENYMSESTGSVKQTENVARIIALYVREGASQFETFFEKLIDIANRFSNRDKTFDELKPEFIKEVLPYEEDYEVKIAPEILTYIGFPPHTITGRKFGIS
jgi:hypothetical protein